MQMHMSTHVLFHYTTRSYCLTPRKVRIRFQGRIMRTIHVFPIFRSQERSHCNFTVLVFSSSSFYSGDHGAARTSVGQGAASTYAYAYAGADATAAEFVTAPGKEIINIHRCFMIPTLLPGQCDMRELTHLIPYLNPPDTSLHDISVG